MLFTVGKIDAGLTLLLSSNNHIIEFPSLLLPSDVIPGQMISFSVQREFDKERSREEEFQQLQDKILYDFGTYSPESPVLTVENVTQNEVILVWKPINLYRADLLKVRLVKRLKVENSQSISFELALDSIRYKVSGLDMEKEYEFHVTFVTSTGNVSTPVVVATTLGLEDFSGLRICFGFVEEEEECKKWLEEMGTQYVAAFNETVTHLVSDKSSGAAFDKARELNVPIVRPEWIKKCRDEKKIVSALEYYLTKE